MRILTITKHVPDSNATIKVKPDGSGIDTNGLKMVIDPFDEFGVELAVQLKEKRGDVSEIVAMTLGPDKAAEALRVALAMGANAGVHINDPSFESVEAARAWMDGRAPVIGLEIDGDARAYPLSILLWHEIVNDVVAGRQVVEQLILCIGHGLAPILRAPDGSQVLVSRSPATAAGIGKIADRDSGFLQLVYLAM